MTFDDVRHIALAWPEVEDGTSYGTPALKVRKKMLVRLKEDGDSLVMPGVPQEQLVIWSLAVLSAPGFMLALRLGRAYTHQSTRAGLLDAILRHQLLYVTYSMLALGFVALVLWEGVFPDRDRLDHSQPTGTQSIGNGLEE